MVCQNSISVFQVGDFIIYVNMDRIKNNSRTVDYDCFCMLGLPPQEGTTYVCLFKDVYGFEPEFLEWDDETREYWSYDQDFSFYSAYGFLESKDHDFYGFKTQHPAFRFTVSLRREIPNFPFERFFNKIFHTRVVEEIDEDITYPWRESIYYVNPHKVTVSSNSIHVLSNN